MVDFNKKLFSIKIDRETTVETTLFIPKFKPPVIVNMLLERGYVDSDDMFEISNKPIAINKTNYNMIEKVICKEGTHSMLVVYITKS